MGATFLAFQNVTVPSAFADINSVLLVDQAVALTLALPCKLAILWANFSFPGLSKS
jgi:hypothetical protein